MIDLFKFLTKHFIERNEDIFEAFKSRFKFDNTNI